MSNVLSVNIPHQLTRAEARRRLQQDLDRAAGMLGPMAGPVSQTWVGDNLDFKVSIAGQSISGKAFVEDQQVRFEVVLPWMLAALAGAFRQRLEQHGREVLGHRPDVS